MPTLLRRTALALVLSLVPAALAQTPFFGEAVPQTHTRYGAFGAEPRLVTNGQHFFLFWANDAKVRVTKLVDGQRRAGRPVLDADHGWFDVVWTGTHFLLAAYDQRAGTHEIRGRLLDAAGEPVNEPFTIVPHMGNPRLAWDGTSILMIYGSEPRMSTIALRPDGVPSSDPWVRAKSPNSTSDAAVAAVSPGFATIMAIDNVVQIDTFRPAGDNATHTMFDVPAVQQRRVAIASRGTEALALWTNGSGAVQWRPVRRDGVMTTLNTPIAGTEGAVDVAAAWNGTKWAVSTIVAGKLQTHFIEGTGSVAAHVPLPADSASPVSLASLNGRTLSAWRSDAPGRPILTRDLGQTRGGVTAAFGAAEQTFHTATSSHDAALFVWSEFRDGNHMLYAGVRDENGGWREDWIGNEQSAPLASSDGNNFLVVKQTAGGWYAVTLDSSASVVASTPVITTFTPTGIAWNGTAWAIIGVSPQSNIYALRVMPWGAVTAPVLIQERRGRRELESPRIAWGGGTFFAVWQDSETQGCFPPCDGYESVLHGARLTDTLQRVDAQNLNIAPDEAVSPEVFWDGTRFAIFWVNGTALETRTLRPNASGSGIRRVELATIETRRLRATFTPFGAAVTSDDGELLLVRDATLIQRYDLGRPNTPDAAVSIGPRIAYVQTLVQDEMPYHGSPHVFVRLGGPVQPGNVPLPPQIVRASMTDDGKLMVVQWTRPMDPANGYRLEYRVDDGTWNELDQWFAPETTSVSIFPWLENVQYHFRLRAWSDAGVSGYSNAKTVRMLGRRRAVR